MKRNSPTRHPRSRPDSALQPAHAPNDDPQHQHPPALTRFIAKEVEAVFNPRREKLFVTGAPQAREPRMVSKGGHLFWPRIEGRLTSGSDAALAWREVASDTSERKQAEAQPDQQRDELRRWHKATPGRQTHILDLDLDLKREVNELLAQAGKPPRYAGVEIAQHPVGIENPSEENPCRSTCISPPSC